MTFCLNCSHEGSKVLSGRRLDYLIADMRIPESPYLGYWNEISKFQRDFSFNDRNVPCVLGHGELGVLPR